TLTVGEVAGQLRCFMQYNTALFAEDTINRMLGHYEELLASAVREPRQRVSQLTLLRAVERQQLVREWNETAVAYETGVTVAELFEQQVARDAAAIAVVSGAREVTYGELNERSNQLAHELHALGVGPETVVGLLLEPSVETIVALLGVLKTGGAY